MSSKQIREETDADAVLQHIMCDDDYYDFSFAQVHGIPRQQLEEQQLVGLQMRFNDLRDRVPILKRLADEQGVDKIQNLEDVVPLLFSHTVYKSYPLSLLVKNRFTQLTQWLDKLTTADLSKVDVSHCQSIDEWIETLDAKTPIRIRHSSGTTGAMSFIPRSAQEVDRHFFTLIVGVFDYYKMSPPQPGAPLSLHVVSPTFRSGYTAQNRTTKLYCDHIAGGDENKIHTLYPGRQSSDLMFLAGRLRAAQAKGELDRLELSPALLGRKAEFEELQRNQAANLDAFYNDMVVQLRSQQVWMQGTWSGLYNLAEQGLAKGEEHVFAPNSLITVGGGAKGQIVPPNWAEKVERFFGVKLLHGYGMTEVMGLHKMCSEERFHIEPWNILFVLDPDTGESLPRKGVQTGRAAFFDLLASTYWGGFVSGDEVTVDWSAQCACGRKTPHIARKIERYSEQRGGDDKITCAAAADAHDMALNYLNGVLG